MTTVSRLALASVATLALTGTAFAEDPPAGDAPATGTDPTAPAADPAVTPPADPAAPDGAVTARWPRAVIARPLTLPKGVFMVGADIVNFTSSFFDPAFMRVLVGYGITDDLELAFAHYAFATSDVGKGSVDAQIGYKLARGAAGGKLEAIARLQGGYSLGAEAANPLGLGVHVQYNVTDKIAIITPGGQLQIGLSDPNPIALTIPVGVGFQATPELYVQLDTTLATIGLKDAGDAVVIFRDTTPISLTATYNVMPALDVLAGVALNLTPVEPAGVGDTFAILLGARYYGGKLN